MWPKNLLTVILTLVFLLITNGMLLGQETTTKDSASDQKIEALIQNVKDLQSQVNAQKPGLNQFRITGFTNFAYHLDLENFDDSRFDHAGFSPIMIWKPAPKLFFESELHIELQGGVHGGESPGGHSHGGEDVHSDPSGVEVTPLGGNTHIDLGYASIGYFINPYMTLVGGKFLSPFGTFNERYHPTWINRLPSAPFGLGHGGVTPAAELGIQLRGGIPLGPAKMNYAIYLSNGPILNDGRENPEDAGKLVYENFADNNANKALGGRLGLLPLPNSSLELGFSGQYAKVGDKHSDYEDVKVMLYAFDVNFIKPISALYGNLQLVGQYNGILIGDAFYVNDHEAIESGADSLYTFTNQSTSWYVQLAFRPAMVSHPVIRDLEVVFRYDGIDLPEGTKWEYSDRRYSFGFNYWIHSRSAFKAAVQIAETGNILLIQWALGF